MLPLRSAELSQHSFSKCTQWHPLSFSGIKERKRDRVEKKKKVAGAKFIVDDDGLPFGLAFVLRSSSSLDLSGCQSEKNPLKFSSENEEYVA